MAISKAALYGSAGDGVISEMGGAMIMGKKILLTGCLYRRRRENDEKKTIQEDGEKSSH